MKRKSAIREFTNSGFNLVELMISMTITLILLAAISGMMVSTKEANTTQNSLARLQENARIALQIVSRDIRRTGYFGCGGFNRENLVNGLSNSATSSGQYSSSVPLQGAEKGSATLFPGGDAVPAGATSDVIAMRFVDGSNPIQVVPPYMNASTAVLNVDTGSGLNKGDIVLVSDCNGGNIFQITGPASGSVTNNVVHNGGAVAGVSPGNVSQDLGRTYSGDASISKFVSLYYFVMTNVTTGQPSLYRRNENGVNQELVQGVERLQILYGIDSDGDLQPDRYVTAGSAQLSSKNQWRLVRTVRINLMARSLANKTMTSDQRNDYRAAELDSNNYDTDGDGIDDLDATTLTNEQRGYVRRVFRTTVWLRNRL